MAPPGQNSMNIYKQREQGTAMQIHFVFVNTTMVYWRRNGLDTQQEDKYQGRMATEERTWPQSVYPLVDRKLHQLHKPDTFFIIIIACASSSYLD